MLGKNVFAYVAIFPAGPRRRQQVSFFVAHRRCSCPEICKIIPGYSRGPETDLPGVAFSKHWDIVSLRYSCISTRLQARNVNTRDCTGAKKAYGETLSYSWIQKFPLWGTRLPCEKAGRALFNCFRRMLQKQRLAKTLNFLKGIRDCDSTAKNFSCSLLR